MPFGAHVMQRKTHTASLTRMHRLRLQCRNRYRIVQLDAHVIISRRSCLLGRLHTRSLQPTMSIMIRRLAHPRIICVLWMDALTMSALPSSLSIRMGVFARSLSNQMCALDGCIGDLFPYRLVREKSPLPPLIQS